MGLSSVGDFDAAIGSFDEHLLGWSGGEDEITDVLRLDYSPISSYVSDTATTVCPDSPRPSSPGIPAPRLPPATPPPVGVQASPSIEPPAERAQVVAKRAGLLAERIAELAGRPPSPPTPSTRQAAIPGGRWAASPPATRYPRALPAPAAAAPRGWPPLRCQWAACEPAACRASAPCKACGAPLVDGRDIIDFLSFHGPYWTPCTCAAEALRPRRTPPRPGQGYPYGRPGPTARWATAGATPAAASRARPAMLGGPPQARLQLTVDQRQGRGLAPPRPATLTATARRRARRRRAFARLRMF